MKTLIYNNETKTYHKFIWKDKQKYATSIKALKKAEKQNKIKIIY